MKLHKEFSYLYNKAKNFHSSSVVLFFIPKDGVRRVGFTATKKVGNAVKRNRAKRRMRALFFQYQEKLQDGLYIFVAKQKIVEIDFSHVENDFKRVLKKSSALKS
ncbi:MAG: ribonuclease P protein component [Epsilonproteobacteria bacterium]|nr:ribonuclease P protein component [Campylobacterota bacterium]